MPTERRFRPALNSLERRDLAAPFGAVAVTVNIPPGIPYRVYVIGLPSLSQPLSPANLQGVRINAR